MVYLEGTRPLGLRNGVTLDFSRLGKLTDNAFVKAFNGRLRNECLNTHWFPSLEHNRTKIEAWRWDYDESHPQTSLGWMTPVEYADATVKIAAERRILTLGLDEKPGALICQLLRKAYGCYGVGRHTPSMAPQL